MLFTGETVYNLHYLSEHFHAVRAVFEDLKERTEHLLEVYRQYPTLTRPTARLAHHFGDVEHSLVYLLAQTRTQMRWVGTYIEHTQIVVDLLFKPRHGVHRRGDTAGQLVHDHVCLPI